MTYLICEVTQFFFNFSDKVSIVRTVSLWVAILYIIALAVCFAVVKDENKKQLLKKVFTVCGGILVAALIITFGYFNASQNIQDGVFVSITFYPLMVFGIILVGSAVAVAFIPKRITKIVCLCLLCASAIAVVACMCVYYLSGEASANNYIDSTSVNSTALWGCAFALAAVIVTVAIIWDKGNKFSFDSRSITYGGVFIALSFALSYVRLFKLPMGGSVTFASTLPIMLYSFMFGTKKGVFIGAIYGVLQAIQDPWILHPAQFLLDYPIAFSAIGLTGIFYGRVKNPCAQFALGGAVAAVARLCAHLLSGVFAFGSYAASYGMSSAWVYSLAYNGAFLAPDCAISVVAGFLLLLSKAFRHVVKRPTQKAPLQTNEAE